MMIKVVWIIGLGIIWTIVFRKLLIVTKNVFGPRMTCFNCPRISRILVQARAEPNDCVKPNEQNRVYSNFAMASNRTFKNLFGLCRAQPKISRNLHQSLSMSKMATLSVALISRILCKDSARRVQFSSKRVQ